MHICIVQVYYELLHACKRGGWPEPSHARCTLWPCALRGQVSCGWARRADSPGALHALHAAPGGLWRLDVPCCRLSGVAVCAPCDLGRMCMHLVVCVALSHRVNVCVSTLPRM